MKLPANRLKALLREGKPAFGLFLTIGHAEVAEMMSLVGYDWLLIDMEHAPIDVATLGNMVIAIEPPTTPLVRVPVNDPAYIKVALDAGVMGVMVPHVDRADEAKLAASYVRYPPRGVRGVGPRRAALYGLAREEYMKVAEDVMLIVQIESREAVDNAEDILSVEGVDAYFIGPADLSASLGVTGGLRNPEVVRAVERVASVGEAQGVPGGIYCGSRSDLELALRLGLRMLALGSDYRLLVEGAKRRLEEARSLT
ncbi:MAG: hypothetical protein DRJ57_06420 [Thermoprotei archaeon]|nr:MAG: hypothetical protein DRJ57_06420 [Thermoprotei archaeon]